MPALPNASHVIRTAIRYGAPGDSNIVNVLHWIYTGTNLGNDQLAFTNALVTAWNVNVMPHLSGTVSLLDVTAVDLTTPSSPTTLSTTAGVAGGQSTDMLPLEVAMVIKEHIIRRYRGGHPRIYLPGIPPAQLATSTTWVRSYADAVAASVQTAAGSVSTSFGALVIGGPCNLSYFAGFDNVVTSPTIRARVVPKRRDVPLVDAVLAFSANYRPGAQRRRSLQGS